MGVAWRVYFVMHPWVAPLEVGEVAILAPIRALVATRAMSPMGFEVATPRNPSKEMEDWASKKF